LAFPIGKALEKWLPTKEFSAFGQSFSLNPGPFNQKEHMLITVMANIGLSSIYASYIFLIQILPMFYGQEWARSKLWQHLIAISMQFLGYGIAGLARSCIVFPDYCIWPALFPTIVLNRSLHERASGFDFKVWRRHVTPFRWLVALTLGYFIWHMYNSSRSMLTF
jgi:OPT oligopeptide transporter protein